VEGVWWSGGDGAEGGGCVFGGRLPRRPLGGAGLRGRGHPRQGASRRPTSLSLSLARSLAAVDPPPCRAFRSWLLAFASLPRVRSRRLRLEAKKKVVPSASAVQISLSADSSKKRF
jgi:hypothetical protein